MLSVLGTSIGNKVMEVASFVCFRIDKQNQTVVLASTDFHAFITMDFGDVSLAGLDDVPEVFLIDYRELSAIVKMSTTEMVEFTDDDANIIVTTNGRYRFRKYLKPTDFPFADMVHEVAVSWPVPEIQSAWSKARIACSKDVTKINYQGIFFDGNFVATDNRRLSVVRGDGAYEGPEMLIPPVFGDVLKHCKSTVQLGINGPGNLLVITCAEVGMMAGVRLIDATFVPYQEHLKLKKPMVTVTVDKQSLLGAIQRLSIFTDKLFKIVEVKLFYSAAGEWKMSISIDNKDAGEEEINVNEVDVEDEDTFSSASDAHPDGFMVVQRRYHVDDFLDGAAVVDSPDDVEVVFQDDGKMWIEEGVFTYLMSCSSE